MQYEKVIFSVPEMSLNIRTAKFPAGNPNWRHLPFHFHDAIEIMRIDEGEVLCSVHNEEFHLEKGSIILFNRRVVHRLVYDRMPADVTYLQIDMDKFTALPQSGYAMLLSLHEVLPYKVFFPEDEIHTIFHDVLQEGKNKHACYTDFIRADFFRIAAIMARNRMMPDKSRIQETQGLQKLAPVLHYVDKNLKNKISLDDACSLIHLDKFYFCKLFKSVTGVTFTEYVNSLRIRSAEDALIYGDKNISEISSDCGFSTIQNFNKSFRAHHHCSPKDFRRLSLPIDPDA